MLRYFPRDSKNRPYDYDMGLSLDEIVAFIKRVASVELVFSEEEKHKEDL